MESFNNGEEAARWLGERLETLEASVQQASELRRLIEEGAREVLVDLDADPALFSRDASDRLRRYTARISQTTLGRLERDGFQLPVLERSSMALLGKDVHLAVEILSAMIETLREHTETNSTEGTVLYGEGRQKFSDASRQIGRAMDDALARWGNEGPGRHRQSRLPWRRRRAQLLRPMDDPRFRQDARNAVERELDRLEEALRSTGQGSIKLAMAKYYGDIVTELAGHISAGDNLRERGPTLRLQADQRLAGIRRQAARGGAVRHSSDHLLMDDETLDAILDRLSVDSARFLMRGDLSSEELSSLGSEELEDSIRAWVEAQIGGLASPSLTEALGGATGDTTRTRQRLLSFLAQGQPLMHYNDDLPLQFDTGLRGQNFVVAETSDPALTLELREACHQMGLPDPHTETVAPPQPGQQHLRVIQFVAGLPLFAQVDRLMEMVDTHRKILIDEDPQATAAAASPGHLRDMQSSAELGGLLPEKIERAFRQEKALSEDPSAGLSLDQALSQDEPEPSAQ